MSAKFKCWIDNSNCHSSMEKVDLSTCELCQKARLSKAAIKHDLPPIQDW